MDDVTNAEMVLMITETGFTVRAREFQPVYLRLGVDEIERRAEEAVTILASEEAVAMAREAGLRRLDERRPRFRPLWG